MAKSNAVLVQIVLIRRLLVLLLRGPRVWCCSTRMLVAWGVLTYGHAARRSTNRRGRLSSQGTRYAICLSSITLRPLLYNATLFSYAISAICLRPLLCITLRYFPTRSLLSAYDLSSILRYAIVLRTLRYYPTTYPLSSYAIVLRAPRYRPTYCQLSLCTHFPAITLRTRRYQPTHSSLLSAYAHAP